MPEHLSRERLSALLDDDDPDARERSHLDACSECERELRRLRRMRMALSALDELEAPSGAWERIEDRLPAVSPGPAGAEGASETARSGSAATEGRGLRSGWSSAGAWTRAAAAVVLFAGGLALGTYLSGPETGPAGTAPPVERRADGATPGAEATEAAGPGAASARGERSRAATGLAELGAAGASPMEAYRDPGAAAERLARLDAMMQAAREAVREDPTDPAMNELLFRVAEDRQALIDALHLATLEYR